MSILGVIKAQIEAASADLRAYRPHSLDWHARAIATAEALIPWLIQVAPGTREFVQDVLNAPVLLRSMWAKIRQHVNLPKEQIAAFDRQLTLDDVLRESVTGEVVSIVVTKYLLQNHPAKALRSNGRSDYPDVFLATNDYSALPEFKRKKKTSTDEDVYGAALKGKERRPVRVPDGIEIKTCRERIAVDCHYAHAGLHLILLFTESSRLFTVKDLQVAFLRSADYRQSEINTTTTTVKCSFNGDRFISLLANRP